MFAYVGLSQNPKDLKDRSLEQALEQVREAGEARGGERGRASGTLGPLGIECSQHRQTLRPTVDGTRSKALRPFGLQ